MNQKSSRKPARNWLSWAIALIFAILTAVSTAYLLTRKRFYPNAPSFQRETPFKPQVQGLTEAEAAARHTGIDLEQLLEAENKQFTRSAIRQNLFSKFNLNLFAIAIIMYILGSPWSTLGTLALLLANTIMNSSRELLTKKKLDEHMESLSPRAAVIRDGELKSIDPMAIVQGDIVVVGPGDQILVEGKIIGEGEIVVNESMHHPYGNHELIKRKGDTLYADSFCLNGRILYEATDTTTSQKHNKVNVLSVELTPLQNIVLNVLRGLAALGVMFSIILLINAYLVQVPLATETYRNAFSLIIGTAPTSLFFIVIMHYIVGTFRIADLGALVYRPQTIESLANVSVLCLSHRTLLRGAQVKLDPITPPQDVEPLSENIMRRILSDAVASIPIRSPIMQILAEAAPGAARTPVEIAPYWAAYGWVAATFNDDDLRGTYVVGDPEIMAAYLYHEKRDVLGDVKQTLTETQQGMRGWVQRLSQRQDQNEDNGTDDSTPSTRGRFANRVQKLLRSQKELEDELETAVSREEPPVGRQVEMLFAYLPTVTPLHDSHGSPQLPIDLIPLSTVHISETIQPEDIETIQSFIEAGVAVKILSDSPPERVAATAQALGLPNHSFLSGTNLAEMDTVDLDSTIKETAVFGQLTPTQKATIIKSLQTQGEYVAMLGTDVRDIPAMRQASISISLGGAAQATLMSADIALMDDTLAALPHVVEKGQSIVNGILDTLKLHLSQVGSQLLLIVFLALLQLQAFPYLPGHGGLVSIFTITIPNIFLIFWSTPGPLTQEKMRRRLIHFILPMAISLSILALAVQYWFLDQYQNIFYAQLGVTFALLGAGWLRVLFLQPPSPFWVGGDELIGDRRIYGLVLGAALLFIVVFSIPLMQRWVRLNWLQTPTDYLVVAIAVIIWAFVLRTVWRIRPLRRYADISSGKESTPQ